MDLANISINVVSLVAPRASKACSPATFTTALAAAINTQLHAVYGRGNTDPHTTSGVRRGGGDGCGEGFWGG
jgi:hypothetical protein